nr:alpha/beta hydrolase [Streptomyces sp. SID3343]
MPGRVENVAYDIAGTTLSGLLARPQAGPPDPPDTPSDTPDPPEARDLFGGGGTPARGVLLAVHGGGSRAAYWHRENATGDSLLTLGAALGWTVLAIDRPGYGASAGLDRARQGLDAQADLLFALIDGFGDVPVFVAAHSMGAILSLRMGADKRGRDLLGLAVGGVPLKYTQARLDELAAIPTEGDFVPSTGGGGVPDTFFGPPGSYDPGLLTRAGRIVAPVPMAEFVDVRQNPYTLPGVLAQVRVPVQWTIAEFERSNLAGPEVLDEARRLLALAPRVETHIQPGVGHNISLHHAARAYHLRVLAFAEECLLARRAGGSTTD